MKVHVDYRDGYHWMDRYTEKHEAAGLEYVEISDELWLLYEKHRRRSRKWQQFMCALDNEQWVKANPTNELRAVYDTPEEYSLARKWLPLLVG